MAFAGEIRMKTAIVTGATGFVGVHLVGELLANGVRVTALCRENSQNINRLLPGAEIVFSPDKLTKSDVFYHLAWEGASGSGRGDAALQARNAEMAVSALMNASKLGCGRFIALGTVYENFAPQIRISGKFNSSDYYILSKDYAHSMASQFALDLGMGFIWCKICHPIGWFIKPEQMMAYTIFSLLSGKKTQFGPAQTTYDIVAVEDVAHGLYLLGKSDNLTKREYYIGSGSPKPLREWLEETKRILGTDTQIGIGERPDDGLSFDEKWFDITELTAETGYSPKVSFADAVKNVAGWVKSY